MAVSGSVTFSIKAKKPKGHLTAKINGVRVALIQRMNQFNADAHRAVATYPPPNSDYRRTGSYGRKWTTQVLVSPNSITGRVTTNLSYAVYVGGPKSGGKGERQTAVMASKGWVSVTTATKDSWDKHKREFSKILLLSSKGAASFV